MIKMLNKLNSLHGTICIGNGIQEKLIVSKLMNNIYCNPAYSAMKVARRHLIKKQINLLQH